MPDLIQLTVLPILLFSVVVHELAHGWAALRLGDPTARDLGRLTLNPVPHIDPVGSVVVPLLSLLTAGTVFIAWAKPVPVDPSRFRNPRRDDILVAAAGPVSNLLLALFSTAMFILVGAVAKAAVPPPGGVDEAFQFLLRMFHGGIVLNVVLGLFNLLPVPPLDGSHVVAALLPPDAAHRYRRIGFAGILILILAMQYRPFVGAFYAVVDMVVAPFQFLINLFL